VRCDNFGFEKLLMLFIQPRTDISREPTPGVDAVVRKPSPNRTAQRQDRQAESQGKVNEKLHERDDRMMGALLE